MSSVLMPNRKIQHVFRNNTIRNKSWLNYLFHDLFIHDQALIVKITNKPWLLTYGTFKIYFEIILTIKWSNYLLDKLCWQQVVCHNYSIFCNRAELLKIYTDLLCMIPFKNITISITLIQSKYNYNIQHSN